MLSFVRIAGQTFQKAADLHHSTKWSVTRMSLRRRWPQDLVGAICFVCFVVRRLIDAAKPLMSFEVLEHGFHRIHDSQY